MGHAEYVLIENYKKRYSCIFKIITNKKYMLIITGNASWCLLHTMVVSYPVHPNPGQQEDMYQFFMLFGRLYPCASCAADFTKL